MDALFRCYYLRPFFRAFRDAFRFVFALALLAAVFCGF